MWYNLNDILSYNCIYNFIVGMRGGGKSFAFKEKAIKNYLRDGSQFIYLRRYKTELYKINTFFEPDLIAKFPDHTFQTKGNRFYIDGQIAGYAIALSRSMIEKSNNYAKVTLIGFDEFILDTSSTYKYLNNEFDVFNNFYDTVDRNKDKTKVLFIGNAISTVNPYFTGLNIALEPQRFTKVQVGGETLAVVEVWSDVAIKEKRSATRFGRLLAGTDYDKFSNDNTFYRDNVQFVIDIPWDDKPFHVCNVRWKGQDFSIWQEQKALNIYVTKRIKNNGAWVTPTLNEQTEKIKWYDFKHQPLGRRLQRANRQQYLYFDSQEVKELFVDFSRNLPT